jgi:aspartyl-tRNA(Asn)/glutamyl-tRNA(Gln) amidotransferase subunit B
VNSFRHVHRAIEHETARLIDLAERGETFKQHTRQWDDETGRTVFLRVKEGSDDYRYFPDPDLPPLVLEQAWIERLRAALPELPEARRQRFVRDLKLPAYDAEVLTAHPKIGDFYESVLRARPNDASWAKRAANFIMTEVLADTKLHGLVADFPVSAAQLVELLGLVDAQTISGKQAKEVFGAIRGSDHSAEAYVREHAMAQVSDEGALEAICRAQIAANPKQAAAYKSGKKGMMGFFVGQVMKETKGSANPALLNQILDKLLME